MQKDEENNSLSLHSQFTLRAGDKIYEHTFGRSIALESK